MAEPPRDVRHVVLPWARPEGHTAAGDSGARERVEAAARALRVQRDRLAIHGPGSHGAGSESGSRQRLGLPPLLSHGLPFKPHPSIPDEDRVPFEPDALLAAAVALDILASRTRTIGPTASVLTELAGVLLEVGRIGGIDDAAVDRLTEYAAGPAGNHRAVLSRRVVRHMADQPTPTGDEPSAVNAPASTPRAAAKALRQLEAAAAGAIHEARLRLEAREVVQYKQA